MTTEKFILPGASRDVTEHWEVDERGNVTIRRQQDASKIIDALRDLHNAHKGKRALGGAGRYVGSVPTVLAAQWARECGFPIGTRGFMEYCKRQMQDFDNAKLLVNRF